LREIARDRERYYPIGRKIEDLQRGRKNGNRGEAVVVDVQIAQRDEPVERREG
jgi:hypothetical protein